MSCKFLHWPSTLYLLKLLLVQYVQFASYLGLCYWHKGILWCSCITWVRLIGPSFDINLDAHDDYILNSHNHWFPLWKCLNIHIPKKPTPLVFFFRCTMSTASSCSSSPGVSQKWFVTRITPLPLSTKSHQCLPGWG